MVSSITLDPYSITKSLKFTSSMNLKIGHPRRPTELAMANPDASYRSRRLYTTTYYILCLFYDDMHSESSPTVHREERT